MSCLLQLLLHDFSSQNPPSFLIPLQLQWLLEFLSSSEQELSLLSESVVVPLVLGVVELPRGSCEDQSPLRGVQLQGILPTRLHAIARLCRMCLTQPFCRLCLLRLA